MTFNYRRDPQPGDRDLEIGCLIAGLLGLVIWAWIGYGVYLLAELAARAIP